MSALRASRAGRSFVGVALGLAAVTAVLLVVLWPSGEAPVDLGPALAAGSEGGQVLSVEPFPCSGFQTDTCRRVEVRLLTGPDADGTTNLELGAGGLDPELAVGDRIRVTREVTPGAENAEAAPRYVLTDFERRAPMLWLALAFAALVILFGRLRGALSLVGLSVSLAVMVLFIVPAILQGTAPLAVAVVGALAVMFATIPLAHGLGPKSVAAMLGTAASLMLTVALAVLFTELTHLTGLSSEEATLLQANEAGLSLEGLLLAGMVIGALGVLDDMTVSQASTVLALKAANPDQSFSALVSAGLRVGRDHVSATVNTLVLAYVGASLPLLLIFSTADAGFLEVVNFEVVAKEVVATLVGSIGLIAAAPVTTALAAFLAARLPIANVKQSAVVHAGHAH